MKKWNKQIYINLKQVDTVEVNKFYIFVLLVSH